MTTTTTNAPTASPKDSSQEQSSSSCEPSVLQRRLEAAGVALEAMKVCVDEDWDRVSQTPRTLTSSEDMDAEEDMDTIPHATWHFIHATWGN